MLKEVDSPISKEDELHIHRRIDDWKSRLIDLSKRNNLVYYKKTKRGTLSVSSPSPEVVFNRLVIKHKKMEVYLPPDEDLPPSFNPVISYHNSPEQLTSLGLTRRDLENTLKNLLSRSRSDYRERGVRILHAAFGMLSWVDENSEEVQSPLLLVPIELEKESVKDPFTISVPPVEEEVVLNPALKEKLKKTFQIELPVLPEERTDQTLTIYLDVINQSFEKFGWKVQTSLEIGLFSFHKLVIYKDLDTNTELISKNQLIRAIAGVKNTHLVLDSLPEEKEVDSIEKPEDTYQVLDADSSQRIAIQYAIRGQSFVMQGPPGTGKSQTIANIISEFIARGNTVLFVSDKMAALEVVYKRLQYANLSSFCLELHSSKANKQEVISELYRSLEEHTLARKLPTHQDYENMKALRESLNNYIISLHQIRQPLQKSAYEILGQLAQLEAAPYVPMGLANVRELTPQKLQQLETIIQQLKNVWQVVEEPDFPWRGYKTEIYNLEIRSELANLLNNLITTINAFKEESSELSKQLELEIPTTLDKIQWLITIIDLIKESPKPEADWITNPNTDELIQEAKKNRSVCNFCKVTRSQLDQQYNAFLYNLPLQRSTDIEANIRELKSLINLKDAEEGSLLEKREQLLNFITLTSDFPSRFSEIGAELAKIFGLPSENLTFQQSKSLGQMAMICFADNKPEKSWFDPAVLQQTKGVFGRAKRDFQEHNAIETDLKEKYSEKIRALNLDELIERYNGPYRTILRWLHPSFYRDRKQIALVSLNGKVPKTAANDLISARRLNILEEEVGKYEQTSQTLFGHYFRKYETNFEKLGKAIDSTSEIHKLSWTTPIPENLTQILVSYNMASVRIKQIGEELLATTQKWNKLLTELNDLMPSNFFPKNYSIDQTSLEEIKEWALQARDKISNLCIITNETLQTRKNETYPKNYKQLLSDLKSAEQVRKEEIEFQERKAQLKQSFGVRFSGMDTNWDDLIQVLGWTERLRVKFGFLPIPCTIISFVALGNSEVVSSTELKNSLAKFFELSGSLQARFKDKSIPGNMQSLAEIESIYLKACMLKARVDDLQLWVDFTSLMKALPQYGLDAFGNRLLENRPPANQLMDIFHKAVYQEWLNIIYDEDPTIGKFRRENHEQLISEFKKLDNELIWLSADKVVVEGNKRKPQGILVDAKETETSVLRREAQKKRRHMPIRTLFQKIPTLLQRLKPCLLMSPISVSQFLTPELTHFDLVIFDEASQLVPEDSIGAIYRGKSVVIAGDDKQLPPTSFFQKSFFDDKDWEEETENDIEVFDSILDVSMGIGLPIKTLRWHYRSKHEDLISFSNHSFYNDRLVTFPSATLKNEALGVKLVYVPNGIYDRGGKRNNTTEAEVVANLVFDHFQKYPQKTLGVVTFSFAQMEAVEDAIVRHREQNPQYEPFFKENRLDGFFVKNLESVQGDERDVIIFSVGYGRDAQGQITMNFGPLNKQGGEHRLNVAITRAKEKVFLVSSIKAADIDLTAIKDTAGVLTLYRYLDYADRGPIAFQTSAFKAGELLSPLEVDVAAEIQKMGYEVKPQVGHSGFRIDLGVVDPNNPENFLLGVECDGEGYSTGLSARDRDRLREQVLNQLGWRIHRVWSPTWVLNKESEVKRLGEAIKQASLKRLEPQVKGPPANLLSGHSEAGERKAPSIKKVSFEGVEKIGVPYRVCTLTASYPQFVKVRLRRYPYQAVRKNEFSYRINRETQISLLERLVQCEGPIHMDYAMQRVLVAWGVKRSGRKIDAAMDEVLYQLTKNGKVIKKGNFLWPLGLTDIPVRRPVMGLKETERKIEQIPPEEIAEALILVVQYAFGISQDSLITETARLFSINHTGENVKESIEKILENLLNTKKLVRSNNIISLPVNASTDGKITVQPQTNRAVIQTNQSKDDLCARRAREILPYETLVKGIFYDKRQEVAQKAKVNETVNLVRDYQNKFDHNAIKVWLGNEELGFIPRDLAQLLAPEMDCGLTLKGTVTEVVAGNIPEIKIKLEAEKLSQTTIERKKQDLVENISEEKNEEEAASKLSPLQPITPKVEKKVLGMQQRQSYTKRRTPINIEAKCRKCGQKYSLNEYLENKFCRKCGTFLVLERTPIEESKS